MEREASRPSSSGYFAPPSSYALPPNSAPHPQPYSSTHSAQAQAYTHSARPVTNPHRTAMPPPIANLATPSHSVTARPKYIHEFSSLAPKARNEKLGREGPPPVAIVPPGTQPAPYHQRASPTHPANAAFRNTLPRRQGTLPALPHSAYASAPYQPPVVQSNQAGQALIDMERRTLFSYLSSPNCLLFSTVEGAIPLTEADLDTLLSAGKGSQWTTYLMKDMNARGVKCKNLNDLIRKVAKEKKKMDEEKKAILNFLTSPSCTLFMLNPSSSVPLSSVLLSPADIDNLIFDSGCGLGTLEALKELQAQGTIVDSLQGLIHALRNQAFQQENKKVKEEKQEDRGEEEKVGDKDASSLRKDLSPAHPLEITPETRALVLDFLSRESTLFSEVAEVKASAAELDQIINACGGNAALTIETLLQIQTKYHMKFNQFSQILPVVIQLNQRKGKEQSVSIEQQRQLLYNYLASPNCTLFSTTTREVKATASELDELLQAGIAPQNDGHLPSELGSVQECIDNLKKLDAALLKFENFKELIEQLKASIRQQSTPNWSPADRDAVLEFLSHPRTHLFSELDDLEITSQQMNDLMNISEKLTIGILKSFNNRHLTFSAFSDLLTQVQSTMQQIQELKLYLLQFLSTTSCLIWKEHVIVNKNKKKAQLASSKVKPLYINLTMLDIDQLFAQTQAGLEMMNYIDHLIAQGMNFDNFQSLVDNIKLLHEVHMNSLQITDLDRMSIVDFLSREDVHLFIDDFKEGNNDIHVKKTDLDKLITEGKGVTSTLFHLSILNSADKQFHSFVDLIPAVQQSIANATEYQKKLLQFLKQHHNRLFHSGVEISEASANVLFFDSTAGLQTIFYLEICMEIHHALFQSIQECSDYLKDIHLHVLRNKYSNYCMERSEQQLTSAAKRSMLLTYLYSSACSIFSEAEDVNLSDQDLDILIQECGNSVMLTVSFLKYIDFAGKKFLNFHPLRSALHDCFLASSRQKKAILDYIRSNKCTLLSPIPAVAKTLDTHDIHRLYLQGLAGPITMSYLLEFEDQHQKFSNFDVLIQHVKLSHENNLEIRRLEKSVLLTYLNIESCSLFHSLYSERSSSKPYSLHSPGPVKPPSELEIAGLMSIGKSGVYVLYYLECLEKQGKKFNSINELIISLKDFKDAIVNRKKDIYNFLKHERCYLIRENDKFMIGDALIDKLYMDVAGSGTLVHLWSLNAEGASFNSLESLMAALKNSVESLSHRAGSQRMMVITYLFSEVCTLFPVMYSLPAALWLKLSTQQIDELIQICESSVNIIRFFMILQKQNKYFQTWDELVDAMRVLSDEMKSGRKVLLKRLQNEDSKLFIQTNGQISMDVKTLKLEDMDPLILRTQDSKKTLFLIDAFETRRAKFASLADLINAVNQAHYNTLASIKQEKNLIFQYLTGPSCHLLTSSNIQPSELDLDQLFLIAGSAKIILFYLYQLENQHRYFQTMPDLISSVQAFHADATEAKQNIYHILIHPRTKLFQNSIIHNNAITLQDAERIYMESEALGQTVSFIKQYEANNQRFNSINQLIDAIKISHRAACEKNKEERLLILGFLGRSNARLFSAPVAAKPTDIDSLIEAGRTANNTLYLLEQLENKGITVKTLPQLVQAVHMAQQESFIQQQAVYDYLTSPRCSLFRDTPHEIIIDQDSVERLFHRAGAGESTLSHIKALDVAGGRFGSFYSFEELIEAVKQIHAQTHPAAGVKEEVKLPTHYASVDPNRQEMHQHELQAVIKQAVSIETQPQQHVAAPESEAPVATSTSPATISTFLKSPHCRIFRSPATTAVSDKQVDAIIKAAGHANTALNILQKLDANGVKCNDADELVPAVENERKRQDHDHAQILSFLQSKSCALFSHPSSSNGSPSFQPSQLTLNDIEQLATQSHADTFTLQHLHHLNQTHQTVNDFSELIPLITQLHQLNTSSIKTQKQMIRTYLSSFHSGLLWSSAPSSHTDNPVYKPLRIRLNNMDLNHLLLETQTSTALLRHLERLDYERKHFNSLNELVSAVRDLHHHHVQPKKDLLDYLRSPSCHLFTGLSSPPSITAAHIDALFDIHHLGLDSLLYVWIIDRANNKFKNMQELQQAVLALQSKSLTGSLSESLLLYTHLSSPLCTLLPLATADANVIVTQNDVSELISICGEGSTALYELFQLDSMQVKCASMRELIHCVQRSVLIHSSLKLDLFNYLSAESNLFHDAAAALASLYAPSLTSSPFDPSDSLHQLPVTVSGVSRIFEEGGCNQLTLPQLQHFDQLGIQVETLRDIIEMLVDQHLTEKQYEQETVLMKEQSISADKKQSIAHQSSIPHVALPAPRSARSSGTGPLLLAAPLTHFSDADRQSVIDLLQSPDTNLFTVPTQISAEDLDEILAAAGSVQETKVLLNHLSKSARRFPSAKDLAASLKVEHASLLSHVDRIYTRLTSIHPVTTLITTPAVIANLTKSNVHDMILDSHTCMDASNRLDELECDMQHFRTLEELTVALAQAQQAYWSRLSVSQSELIQHLSQPHVANNLFSTAVDMTEADIHAVLLAGRGSGRNVIAQLNILQNQGLKFASVPALIQAIKHACQVDEQQLVQFLASPSSHLFTSPTTTSYLQANVPALQWLYGSAQTGPKTLEYVNKLNDQDAAFKHVHELVVAIQQLDQNNVPAPSSDSASKVVQSSEPSISSDLPPPSDTEVADLVTYLSDPTCLLFSDSGNELNVDTSEISHLFAVGGGLSSTLEYLSGLNAIHRKFSQFSQLAPAVKHAREKNYYCEEDHREKLEQFLNAPTTTILANSKDRIHKNHTLQLTGQQADELLKQGNGFDETMYHLQMFNDVKRHFTQVSQLAPALYHVHQSHCHLSEGERAALLSFFTSPDARLMKGKVAEIDLDQLMICGQPLDVLLSLLERLNAANMNIQTSQELCEHVRYYKLNPHLIPAAVFIPKSPTNQASVLSPRNSEPFWPIPPGGYPACSSAQQQQIVDYLGQSALFSESDTELQIDSQELDALVYHCQGVPHLLDILRTLDSREQRFKQFSQLPPAVQAELDKRPAPTRPLTVDTNVAAVDTSNSFATPTNGTPKNQKVSITPVASKAASPAASKPASRRATGTSVVSAVQPAATDAPVPPSTSRPASRPASRAGSRRATATSSVAPTVEVVTVAQTASQPAPESTTQSSRPSSRRATATNSAPPPAIDNNPADAPVLTVAPQSPSNNNQTAVVSNPVSPSHARTASVSMTVAPNDNIPVISDEARDALVAWLSTCQLFSASEGDLQIESHQLDILVHEGGGIDQTLHLLRQMDLRQVKCATFNDVLPGLKHQKTLPNIDVQTVTDTQTVQIQIPQISDAERDELVAYLGATNLFSEASDSFKVESDDLDVMVFSAKGVTPLLDYLRSLDSQGVKFREFSECMAAVQKQFPIYPPGSNVLPPQHIQGNVVSADDRNALVEYIQTCNLFADSTEPLSVEEHEIDQLISTCRGLANCLNELKALDACYRRFTQFSQLQPAIVDSMQSGSHLSNEDAERIVQYLSDESIGLFSDASQELQVEMSQMDQLVAVGRGTTATIQVLQQLDQQKQKFNSFAELIPAVDNYWKSRQ